ncbi:MAG: FAD-dependent oxidoreductase, partial [Gammaproteobacteria bacterium]
MSAARSARRIADGVLTDASKIVEFEFDGRLITGLAGDTVASALLANDVQLVGRSFKYHRPRGIITAGPEEPCALIDILGATARAPNRPATTVHIAPGLRVASQNRWPSLKFDLLSINSLFSAVLPAGFYYKTFTRPSWAWEKIYEPAIRRAAGLGKLERAATSPGEHGPVEHGEETVHDHADVLIIGAGAAGLAAARRLAGSGLRVILIERDVITGGGTLLDPRWQAWRDDTSNALARSPTVHVLTRTQIIAAYDHGVFGAVETLTDTGPPHRS